MIKKYLFVLVTFSQLFEISAQTGNFWSNEVYRTIYQYQETRNTQALIKYFRHKDVLCRKLSVRAFASVQDTTSAHLLLKVLNVDKAASVRLEAAYSLGQLRKSWLYPELLKSFKKEGDVAVKACLLEAIGKCCAIGVVSFFENVSLANTKNQSDERMNHHFAKGVYFASKRGYRSDSLIRRVKLLEFEMGDSFISYVYNTLNRKKVPASQSPIIKNNITYSECIDSLKKYENAYRKVAFLENYKPDGEVYLAIAFSAEPDFLKSYCMEQYFKGKVTDDQVIRKCLSSNNIAFVAMAAEKIRTDSLWRDSAELKVLYLSSIKRNITMPRDFEAYVELEKTICYLQKKLYAYTPPDYNHPVNWAYIGQLKDVEKVKIITEKGSMIMTCFVKDAPASAANFLRLVDSGYYNSKYFHRMVPEFVVQGGCPRGDGWGALNWTQRSEFCRAQTYHKGSVGLASAGKDSEGVQFFITHGFTPSLDGRYTIFGEITEGLEIIDLLKVGDMILSIERIQ